MNRWVGMALMVAFLWGVGCESASKSPVGSALVGRNSGRAVELPGVALSGGTPRFEGIVPQSLGGAEELLVGKMNGMAYRSLLRFRVNADSLAGEGNSVDDLEVESLRLTLGVRSLREPGEKGLAVGRPEGAWNESSVFVDTLSGVEIEMLAAPIPGALAVVQGNTALKVDLPASFVKEAMVSAPSGAQIDLMLVPEVTSDFILELVSGDAPQIQEVEQQPKVELVYSVKGEAFRYETGLEEDTYWGARVDGGPDSDRLYLSTGIIYSSILRFELPETIPAASTVNSVQLEVDVDGEYSFFNVFTFRIDRMAVDSATGDTTFTAVDNRQLEPGVSRFDLSLSSRTIVQGWLAKTLSNHGFVLRPVQSAPKMDWVVIRNARLKLVYSVPPDL